MNTPLSCADICAATGLKASVVLKVVADFGVEATLNQPLAQDVVLEVMRHLRPAQPDADDKPAESKKEQLAKLLQDMQTVKGLCDRHPKLDRQRIYGRILEDHWNVLKEAVSGALAAEASAETGGSKDASGSPGAKGAEVTDSMRLDWMLSHQPTVEQDKNGTHLAAYYTSSEAPDGVSGNFIAYGATARECLDKHLTGNAQRVY